MSQRKAVRRKTIARGYAIHLLLDPSLAQYFVLITKDKGVAKHSGPFTKEEGEELFDIWDVEMQMKFGLRETLARCMDKPKPLAAPPWVGSMEEVAAKLFGLGTWEWVLALRALRRQAA